MDAHIWMGGGDYNDINHLRHELMQIFGRKTILQIYLPVFFLIFSSLQAPKYFPWAEMSSDWKLWECGIFISNCPQGAKRIRNK